MWSHLQTAAAGYFCEQSICHKCPLGTYGTDGKGCNPCPYATWTDVTGAKSCKTSFLFSKPGKQKMFIPYGVSKINVKLWGGGGSGSDKAAISDKNIHFSVSGGGGGFSSCNISVTPNEYVYIIVASGGSPSSEKYRENLEGGCTFKLCQELFLMIDLDVRQEGTDPHGKA